MSYIYAYFCSAPAPDATTKPVATRKGLAIFLESNYFEVYELFRPSLKILKQLQMEQLAQQLPILTLYYLYYQQQHKIVDDDYF